MAYTHVLLDLDHTLLDTDRSLELAFDDAMRSAGTDSNGHYATFDQINSKLWRQVEAGALTPDQVHITRFEVLNVELDLAADPKSMADAFADGMGTHGDLYAGAREMLEVIASVATLALVTNGLSGIQRTRLSRLDLHRYFDAVTISAEVGVAKPNPDIFDLTFEALGSPSRQRALMVGDNLGSDIAGGINAGIDTCWYNPSQRPVSGDHIATHDIATFDELIAVVRGNTADKPTQNPRASGED